MFAKLLVGKRSRPQNENHGLVAAKLIFEIILQDRERHFPAGNYALVLIVPLCVFAETGVDEPHKSRTSLTLDAHLQNSEAALRFPLQYKKLARLRVDHLVGKGIAEFVEEPCRGCAGLGFAAGAVGEPLSDFFRV